jgi:hypothetical protein
MTGKLNLAFFDAIETSDIVPRVNSVTQLPYVMMIVE